MPRARRRRSHSANRRSWAPTLLVVVLLGSAVGLAAGSLVEVHAQSSGFRTSTDTGYGQLASLVAVASNRTGSDLARLMDKAAQLPNHQVPQTARGQIQQGLDEAVSSASQQAARAADLVPPYPTGSVSAQFSQVMSERAKGATAVRTTVDQLLGMNPLPIAGAPSTSTARASAPLISINQATASMAAAGLLFQHADADYRNLLASVHRQRIPIHLPASIWVPSPTQDAALGPASLGATASSLSSSVALIPFHQLVITAVGLSPPAVTSGASGIVGDSCSAPVSTVAGSTPTVLPPTTKVSAAITVTNCGTVVESGIVVSQTMTLDDPAGTAPPPPGARGGSAQARVSLRSGSSVAPSLPSLSVAGGHLYNLVVAVTHSPNQGNLAGTSQQFLLQISK